jgi:hypothetical protein
MRLPVNPPLLPMLAVSIAASLPWLACSAGPSATGHDGGRDGASAAGDGGADTSGPYDPNGPYAACNDPLTQTSTLRATGFEAWNGLAVLGCFNPSQPVDVAKCDDAIVMGGAFTIMLSVCTGDHWDVHVFDGLRGLDCNTTRAAIDKVFTLTLADCKCASPGRLPAMGCDGTEGGVNGDAGLDAVGDAPADSNNGGAG